MIILPVLSLIGLAYAIPFFNDGPTATVPLVKSTKAPPLDGPAELRKVYARMGWNMREKPTPIVKTPFDIHVHAVAASGDSDIGRVYATPEAFQSEYLCPVTVGGQDFMLNFDTGSSDLWMFSTSMNETEIGQHAAFDARKSRTFQRAPGLRWSIGYADGSGASGTVGYDTVQVGGVTQTRQAIELATEVSEQFTSDPNSDGLLGLGFDSINQVRPQRQQSFFQHIKHTLNKRVFSVNLREDGSGFYEFGRVTPGAYQGELTRVPCDMTRGWWEFEAPAYDVAGDTLVAGGSDPVTAIADTGTTLLIVDAEVAEYYYSFVPNSGYSYDYGGWLYPCNQQDSMPPFGVSMGSVDHIIQIPMSILTYGPVTQTWCYGAVQDNNGFGLQIFGAVVYRSAFIAHLDWRGVPGTNGFLGLAVGAKA